MDYGGLYLQRGLQSPNLAHGGPSPNTFLGGYRVPAIESRAGAGAAASEADSPWPPEFLVPPWLPGQSILPWFSALPWLPELLAQPWLPGRSILPCLTDLPAHVFHNKYSVSK